MMDGGVTDKDRCNISLIQNLEQLKVVNPWLGQQTQVFLELFCQMEEFHQAYSGTKINISVLKLGFMIKKHFITSMVII